MLFGRHPSDFIISRQRYIDYRESAMPDSPDIQSSHSSTLSPKVPLSSVLNTTGRPLSSNSSISGINGHHSPLSALNGRTPSPNGPLMNPSMGQQLPPACGARQLSKLKRFLTTLQQFGSDISPEIGERVRSLVLGLVNSHLSIEEFHSKLQEATNFPLRPFVIPFLKANLPLLQRELLHCARMAKQNPQQFLAQNEHVIFDPAHSPLDPRDSANNDIINENGKRVSPDRPKENGLNLHLDVPSHPAKRHHHSGSGSTAGSGGGGGGSHPISPLSGSRVSPGSTPFNFGAGGPIRLEDISKSREMRERLEREQMDRERERERTDRDGDRHFSSISFRSNESFDNLERLDDDWRHVETMLNCIMGMVDKTKRAIAILQDRSMRDREELSLWTRRQNDALDMGTDVKKRPSSANDPMSFAIRHTEDRVTEVRRRAEEAVNDVKRQAMLELQKAMSVADQKALDLVANERTKMERALSEVRKQAQDDVLKSLTHQEESTESCWNCGRKASETCSGCNVARYCGSFCQHKDWDTHHHVCGKAHITSLAEAREHRRAALAAAATAASTPSVTTSVPPTSTATSSSSLPSSSTSSSAVNNTSTNNNDNNDSSNNNNNTADNDNDIKDFAHIISQNKQSASITSTSSPTSSSLSSTTSTPNCQAISTSNSPHSGIPIQSSCQDSLTVPLSVTASGSVSSLSPMPSPNGRHPNNDTSAPTSPL